MTLPPNQIRQERSIILTEYIVGGLITLGAILMLWSFYVHSGPLWRDEAATVGLATQPTWHQVWASMEHENFFAIWNMVLRGWVFSGLGAADSGLRVLGLLIGIGIFAAIWVNGLVSRKQVPLVALALLAANAVVIVFGSSIRGYGLGLVAGLSMFTSGWALVRSPSRKSALLCLAISLFAVHILFYNAIVVFAVCMGGIIVLIRRREIKRAMVLLGIGVISAATMLIYVPAILRSSEWNMINKSPDLNVFWIWDRFVAALTYTDPSLPWFWVALTLVGIVVGLLAWNRRLYRIDDSSRGYLLYCSIVLSVIFVAYLLALILLRYPTQPWYYLILMGLAAAAIDGIIGVFASDQPVRVGRLVGCLLLCLCFAAPVWNRSLERRSNIDIVASRLQEIARPGDCIILSPWYYGVSFNRYYHGSVPWNSLPLEMPRDFHRYNVLKQKMLDRKTITPLIDSVETALKNGNTVWIVGEFQMADPKREPPAILLPSEAPWGWNDGNYYTIWMMHVGRSLQIHATQLSVIPLRASGPVNQLESVNLISIRGYH